jgi:hypothetical protein
VQNCILGVNILPHIYTYAGLSQLAQTPLAWDVQMCMSLFRIYHQVDIFASFKESVPVAMQLQDFFVELGINHIIVKFDALFHLYDQNFIMRKHAIEL